MKTWIAVAVTVVSLATAAGALAHEGHEHKILGTVTMAAADHVMVKDREGKSVTVQVTADTKVTRNKQVLTIADVKANTRVVISAVTDKERMVAKTIDLGPAPKP